MFRHGSSKKGPRQNKQGVWSRGRTGQAVAAHHGRIRIGSVHSQIKKRMWKSAIARAKRIGDHGRKAVPLVKMEAGHHFASIMEDAGKGLVSLDDDDSDEEVVGGLTSFGVGTMQTVASTQAVAANEEVACEPKSVKRNVASAKKAAISARKKLAKARNK